jgi:hypothetical protein
MNRRRFIGGLGITAGAVTAAPALVAAAAVAPAKPKPLPPIHAGEVLTAKTINDIVDRMNELGAR